MRRRAPATAKKLKQITLLRDPTPIAAVVRDSAEAKCDYGADEIFLVAEDDAGEWVKGWAVFQPLGYLSDIL